jgi:hypothetical protein
MTYFTAPNTWLTRRPKEEWLLSDEMGRFWNEVVVACERMILGFPYRGSETSIRRAGVPA